MGLFSFLKKNNNNKRLSIIDVSDADFKQKVIQRSYRTPVMVDYWAAWCMPCRQLGPVLERMAESPDSDFILAKLNTENNRRTAAQYSIHSIPAVKLFRNGQVVDEFVGALPEPLVRRFVDKATGAPPPAPRIQSSSDPAKRLRQAEQHLKRGRGFEAFVALDNFPDSPQHERAESLLPLAEFLFDVDLGDGLTGLESLDEEYLATLKAMKRRQPGKALDHLFSALEAGDTIDENYTADVIRSLLSLLGEEHKLTKQSRDRLEIAGA